MELIKKKEGAKETKTIHRNWIVENRQRHGANRRLFASAYASCFADL
jgi:hypothetical protein